jgi:transcriptional regulator with XRE-family HTH domain
MENQLAKNIREHRKRLGLTQELLAERLGITLGTVSKWERGESEPDLGFIMDLAELFHVSVDALIGFSMRGADADEEAERIEALVNQVPFEEVEAEYENALRKFPNHFRTVLGAASICRRFGTLHREESYVRRALELYRHAIVLLPQNRDPEINEVLLRNEIAGCYSELKDYKKAVEEYKKNNLSGNNNGRIGLVLIRNLKKPEEGIEYTAKAFVNHFSKITTVMWGNILYYMETGDFQRGIRAAAWSIDHLTRSKEDPARRSYPDKIICLLYLLQAVLRDLNGQTEGAEEDLRRAVSMARAFDSDPVYTLENMLFTEHAPKNVYFYDDSGPTAVEGLRGTLEELGDLVPPSFRGKIGEALG